MKQAVWLLALGLARCAASLGFGEEPTVVNVWPDKVPGEVKDLGPEKVLPPRKGELPVIRLTNVSQPTISVYRPAPEKNTGAAVLIAPGGGYHILAWDKEGEEVAQWLSTLGVTGIVLKYRVPAREGLPRHEPPLQDAQRALSLVRSKAKEWKIDPNKIGMLGFSAGGHLAATTATNFAHRSYEPVDEVDKISCRPDFAVLIYPAYLVNDSKDALTDLIHVTKDTPPTFLVHASDDGVPAENSAQFYLALKKVNVPAELHLYGSGGHGFGLRKSDNPVSQWPARCEAWLRNRQIIPAE